MSLALDRPATEGDSRLSVGDTLIITINPPRPQIFRIGISIDGTAAEGIDGENDYFIINSDNVNLFREVFISNSCQTKEIYSIRVRGDRIDEPDETTTLKLERVTGRLGATPADVVISTTAGSVTFTIRDDDPTIVTLARTGSGSAVGEGETIKFTVILGRAIIAGEIIDVPLTVSGTNITTTDWSLAAKSGDALNTCITLVNETTTAPVMRFTGAGAQTATLLLTAAADNTAEKGGPETLTLALGPNEETTNGFDLNTHMTNVGGGADPNSNAAKNTFNVTINDDITALVPAPLTDITEQCELRRANLPVPTATDNQMGTVRVTNNITNFPIMSTTTITWTYTDASGNTAVQTQAVVIDDDMPPTPNPSNDLSEVIGQCPLRKNDLTIPAATDNCTGAVTVTNNIVNFPITSDTTITWTYIDDANNTATQTQQVTIDDMMAPIPALADLLILEACSQITSLTAPTASDNCNGTIKAATDAAFPITSTRTITCTYRDAACNTATQKQEVICPLSVADNIAEAVIPLTLRTAIWRCALLSGRRSKC